MKHILSPFLPFATKLVAINSPFIVLRHMFNGQMLRAPKASTFSFLAIYHIFKKEWEHKEWFN